jgi:hypothetical protein
MADYRGAGAGPFDETDIDGEAFDDAALRALRLALPQQRKSNDRNHNRSPEVLGVGGGWSEHLLPSSIAVHHPLSRASPHENKKTPDVSPGVRRRTVQNCASRPTSTSGVWHRTP